MGFSDVQLFLQSVCFNGVFYYIFICLFGALWCPTDKMIADFLTKPLQGKLFIKFRDVLMGAVPMWYDID